VKINQHNDVEKPQPEEVAVTKSNSFFIFFIEKKWQQFGLGLVLTAIIGVVAMQLAPLPGLAVLGSLTIALLLGIGWRGLFGLPKVYGGGVQFSARRVLRFGIILTGVRLNFGLIVSSGLQVLFLDTLLIIFGVFFIPWLGKKLGLTSSLALMLGVGQSICGASAVGAIAPLAPGADQDEVSLAVAICGIMGTVGVLLFIFALNVLNWQSHFYGLLTGSTLHEIAQVAAAGPAGGQSAFDLAMVVKLTRVVLLAPVALALAFLLTLRAGKESQQAQKFDWRKLPIPWFVLGFLIVGAVNSVGWLSKDLSNITLQVSIFLMVMAMAAMGLLVDLKVIRKTGLRALGVSFLAFAAFTAVSLGLIAVLGMI